MTVWENRKDSDCDRRWTGESVVSRVTRLLLPSVWSNGFCTIRLTGLPACRDFKIHYFFPDCNNFFRANLRSKI